MPNFARGAAFVDRTGTVLAADPGFLAELALEPADPTGALRRRAESEPALKDLIAGVGPAAIRLMGPDGGAISVERQDGPGGALLLTRTPRDGEWLEHTARSQGLARLAAGLAHDIKNPLNAMALQLALLGEKLGEGELAASSAGHLGALRDQITKVNEVVRRFCDVTDPAAPYGWVDLGAVLADIASLFGHELRRRRIRLSLEAPRGTAKVGAPPERVVRLLLGLFGRAVAETPDGGAVEVRAAVDGDGVQIRLEHAAGDPDPDLLYYSEVAAAAAAALGGSLSAARSEGQAQIGLRLPKGERA